MVPFEKRLIGKSGWGVYPRAGILLALGILAVGCAGKGTDRTSTTEVSAPPQAYVLAAERMKADGSLNQFVTTRKKVGRQTTPKYPGKAWDWFVRVRLPLEDQARTLPPFYREDALEVTRQRNMNKASLTRANAAWRYLGPGGQERDGSDVFPSGRIVEIAVAPNDSNVIYAGAASGGLFKTSDQGRHWTNVTDESLPSLGLGSVTVSPFDANVVLLGMGEGVPGSHYEPTGAGVYRSNDAGGTWTLVPGTSVFEHVVDLDFLGDNNSIVVAAKGRKDGRGGGLYVTTNGGQTWTTASQEPFYDISVDPANRQDFLVTRALYNDGGTTQVPGIFRSVNGGQGFAPVTTPPMLNAAQNVAAERIELARNGSTVYALIGGTDLGIFGVWRSTDNGATFTARPMSGIPADGDFKPKQMNYNCAIEVDPSNPQTIYIGTNLRAYRSTDGGGTFTAITDWAGDDNLPYIHADHHKIWVSSDGRTIYYATDGGLFVSTDKGATWTERNNGFTATQLYRIGTHPTVKSAVIMGAQDNDKYLRRADGTWHHYPNTWGDGMEMIAWPGDPNVFMGTNYFGGNTRVSFDAGDQWYFLRNYGEQNNGIPDAEQGAWVSPFLLDPQDQTKMYLQLQNLYAADFSTETVPVWRALVNLPGTPDTMELLKLTAGPSNRKFVGFLGRRDAEGTFTVSLWRGNLDGTQSELVNLPRLAWVSGLEVDPNANETIWIGYSDLFTDQDPKPRLYKSTDLGNTWTDMTNDFPANLPVSAIWIDPQDSNTIIVGSDIGVYRSENGGQNWVFWNEGLPKVVVNEFEYFAPERLLRASTYGRGLWETALDPKVGEPDIRVEPINLIYP